MKPLNLLVWLIALVRSFQSKNSALKKAVFSNVYQSLVNMGIPASVAAVIGELVTGVVMLFVGLFMLDAVYGAIGITNESPFYTVSTSLLTTTGTIFSVLGVVIIIIALATGIGALKNMF
jgi:hypothetical protein